MCCKSSSAKLDASNCVEKVVVPNWDGEVAVPYWMLQWVQCLKSPKCVFTSSSTHPRSMISPYSIIFHSAKLSFSHNFLWLYFRFTFPGPWKKSPAWQAQATAFHKEPGYCVCDILTSLFYICNRIYHIHYVLHMFIQWSYILCIICSIYISIYM